MSRRPRTATFSALLVGAATAVTLTACSSIVVDMGEPVTQEREVSDVSAVTLGTTGQLSISIGTVASLTIIAGEGVIDLITTEVAGGHLVIDLPGRLVNVGQIRYELVVPTLESVRVDGAGDISGEVTTADRLDVDISGAGDVDLTGVDVEDLAVSISGAGAVELAGAAERQEVRIDGAGIYHGGGIETADADVSLSGAGSADVHATRTLVAEIAGAGEISYTGDPEVTTRLDGIGRVHRK